MHIDHTHRHTRAPSTPAGGPGWFTLIELLVVITIISILASLLLPALGRAKLKGKSAICMNQLKQIGTAIMMYCDDHDGFLNHYNVPVGNVIMAGTVNGDQSFWLCKASLVYHRDAVQAVFLDGHALRLSRGTLAGNCTRLWEMDD